MAFTLINSNLKINTGLLTDPRLEQLASGFGQLPSQV